MWPIRALKEPMAAQARQFESQGALRVLVVDDRELSRICLRKSLEAEDAIEVAADLGNGVGIVEQVSSLHPDIVLLDLDMPGGGGFAALRTLAEHSPECPVLVLSAVEDRASLTRAVELGARGIVLKRSGIDELKQALRELRRGGKWLSGALPDLAQSEALETDDPLRALLTPGARLRRFERWTAPSWSRLTAREREVAALVAQGTRYSEVARKLAISQQTVKNHVRRVFDKLEVTNRLQLALFVANRKPV